MSHRAPDVEVKATWNDQPLIDFQLSESNVSSKKLLDVLPHLHSAVTVLWDWIRWAEAVREKKAEEKASGLLREEKYGGGR